MVGSGGEDASVDLHATQEGEGLAVRRGVVAVPGRVRPTRRPVTLDEVLALPADRELFVANSLQKLFGLNSEMAGSCRYWPIELLAHEPAYFMVTRFGAGSRAFDRRVLVI